MTYKHKTSDIQETNNRKFLTDDERVIVENINRYNSSNHSFDKSIQLRNSKKVTIPRINIEGECYQNILDMGNGISYSTYSISNGEVELIHKNKDFIWFKNIKRDDAVLVWINPGNILDFIKPSTNYTLVLDFYSDKTIKRTYTKIMGHDMQNVNSNAVDMAINKKSGRLFIPITTLSTIDKSNPKMACIYNQFAVDNLSEGDDFYFGNVRLFEGNITENNYKSNGRINGITGIGDKCRNLFNPKTARRLCININDGTVWDNDDSYIVSEFIKVEGGEQYLLYDELDDYVSSRYILEYDGDKNFIRSTRLEVPKPVNFIRFTLDPNTSFVIVRFWSKDRDNGYAEIRKQFSPYRNIMFRKDDDEVCSFEPYYEGYKISIHSISSNIFDPSNLVSGNLKGHYDYFKTSDRFQGEILNNRDFYNMVCSKNLIRIKPNTTYQIKRTTDYSGLDIKVEKIMFYDENKRSVCGFADNYGLINVQNHNFRFTTHNNVLYMRLVFYVATDKNVVLSPSDIEKCGFIISEVDTNEEYRSDSCDIYLDYPLLKLPDDTKDEIKDGYLIRRIGKVVLNGNEKWVASGFGNQDDTMAFALILTQKCFGKFGKIGVMCLDFKSLPLTSDDLLIDTEVFMDESTSNNKVLMRVNRSRLETQDLNGFKKWLSQNPTTVYYELETPIITKINQNGLSTFDNYAEVYTDTNLSSSKHFTLPGNLNSKISANKERLFSLRERINKLEEISLTSVINTIDIKEGKFNEEV